MNHSKVLKLLGFLICTLFYFNSTAQVAFSDNGVMYLNKNEKPANTGDEYKRGSYVGPHILGDTITGLLNKFEHDYTYYKPSGGAYSTDMLVINKLPIYKSVKKINKHYEKALKKGKVEEQEAYNNLKKLLLIAIKLNTYYTAEVEEHLKKIKDPEELEEYILSLKFQ